MRINKTFFLYFYPQKVINWIYILFNLFVLTTNVFFKDVKNSYPNQTN